LIDKLFNREHGEYSVQLVSLADSEGFISEACAPDWFKKMEKSREY